MKIIGFILAFLFLCSAAFVGIIGGNKARHLASDVSELTAGLSDAELTSMSSDIPSAGRLKAGGIAGLVAGAGALALLVAAFVKKSSVPGIAAATVGLGALAAAILPHVETGPLDGMAPRMQAIVALVLAAIGAGGALLAARRKA